MASASRRISDGVRNLIFSRRAEGSLNPVAALAAMSLGNQQPQSAFESKRISLPSVMECH